MSRYVQLRDRLQEIRGRHFLVVGDLYLDRYIFGQPARVSREAPIMVLDETRREDRPGGGCAPALALAKLGARVEQIGIIGADEPGEKLRDLVSQHDIGVDGVLTDASRPTTVKTRIVAEGAFNVFPQQVSRVDRQDRSPLDSKIETQVIESLQSSGAAADAVLLSDYRSGVVTRDVIAAARSASTMSTVDSQGALRDFAGLDLIKCNQAEAEQVLGRPLDDTTIRREELSRLRAELETGRLVVTLGPEGAALVSGSSGYQEFPPPAQQFVFDVTGAGDTVIALLTGVLASGGDDRQAVELSQIAAGLVIARWGNAQASAEEILAELDGSHER